MVFSVSEFEAQGIRGGARPNKFRVNLFLPDAMRSSKEAQIQFLVEAASVPEGISGVVRVPYMGRTVPYPGDPEYPDWNVTVQLDTDYTVHKIMRKWQTYMNTPDSNVMNPGFYPDLGKGTAEVTQYALDGSVLQVFRLRGIFPTTVSPIVLNWANNNQYATFDVTFAQTFWEQLMQTGVDDYSSIAPNDQKGK